jgi:chromosomal replication initiator protein
MARPPRVLMRSRKPCLFLRFRFLGRYVGLPIFSCSASCLPRGEQATHHQMPAQTKTSKVLLLQRIGQAIIKYETAVNGVDLARIGSVGCAFAETPAAPRKRAMELTAAEAWARILERARPLLPEKHFRGWLEQTEPMALTQEQLSVLTWSDFAAQWLEDKYGSLLDEVAERVLGRPLSISFRPKPQDAGSHVRPSMASDPVAQVHTAASTNRSSNAGETVGVPLNERYSFDRFVVGANNTFAHAACCAVAESPANRYNPLFIYGGVGLGKTHLMHAIGHTVHGREPGKRISYVSSERFTNDLIGSIQEGRMAEFRRRYREMDLLLIDDVHFLGEKERTQEEFFHTFNALYDAKRQIVMTSDRPPKEIPGLEDRLVSRFAWGLVTDIKPPDLETRVAILRKKAESDEIQLADDVFDFIARNCRSNVRELEGAIIKLLAYSSLTRREVTIDLAREALGGELAGGGDRVDLSAEAVREAVAREWSVTVDGLVSKKRTKELTVPRQVAMYLIRDLLGASLVEIGKLFGGRDHSTVIHSVSKVEGDLRSDEAFRERVGALRARIGK